MVLLSKALFFKKWLIIFGVMLMISACARPPRQHQGISLQYPKKKRLRPCRGPRGQGVDIRMSLFYN